MPLADGAEDVPWPCNAENKYIVHFPETREIWSYGSGYGGNALLGKKCFALRIASVMARDEGWMAEHMLILKLTSPEGEVKYIAGAFPSACGKTNLAMLIPTLQGWKVETIGDDIAWMKFGADGRLYAINPEAGFFGVAPGTGGTPTRTRSHDRAQHDLHQLRAHRRRRRLVGGSDQGAARASDRLARQRLDAGLRAAGRASQRPLHDARSPGPGDRLRWEDPAGVPIDAILFGGRRATVVPLVTEALDWEHGVFLGSIMSSEKTAAAAGTVGELRFDPFAMLPFCGYNMADYFAHWLEIGHREGAKLPKIFYVNWFRKDSDGRFLWPGLRRELARAPWVFARCAGHGAPTETPIGLIPPVGGEGIDTARPRCLGVGHVRAAARGDRGVEGPAAAVPRASSPSSRTCPRSCTRSCRSSRTASARRLGREGPRPGAPRSAGVRPWAALLVPWASPAAPAGVTPRPAR